MKISILILLVFCALLSGTAHAQENGLELIDEFGRLNDEERLVRTEHLTLQIRNDPDKIGLIRISGGRSFSPFAAYLFGALFRAQLEYQLKVDRSSFDIQTCSVNDPEMSVRFYLAARDAKRPDCDTGLPFLENTELFTTKYYENPKSINTPCCEVIGAGRAVSDSLTRVLSEMLKNDPGSKLYLLGYAGTNVYTSGHENAKGKWVERKRRILDDPAAIAKMMREATKSFSQQDIEASRIIRINGGYQDSTGNVEFWFVPTGGDIPNAKPNYWIKKRVRGR